METPNDKNKRYCIQSQENMRKKRESETAEERERHLKREFESRRQKPTKCQLENNNAQNQDTNLLYIESPSVNIEQQLSESDQDLLQNFHTKINKLANKLYSICKEYFPLIELIGVRKEYHHCYYDTKDVIKKFSKENNMDPGNVPEELQGLTEIEEMLIAQIFPVILVYCLHRG
ncbi:25638_t:CDS:1 [Dentiscutata erythropus]|uniref:25638_t:CDS:1 n=1 Tax=Dentiscutata erythropus TaxID=1348616 RepID=A0A9N9NDW1_9GLOM|nr:25638_t:CDS:1 [Dentiscutata erythropus]